MAVKCKAYSTRDMEPGKPASFDCDDAGTSNYRFTAPCADMVSASAQVIPLEVAAGTAFVLTVIVSNDPAGNKFENHPSSITLTNSARITAPFSVVGYLFFGVKLTTINGGNMTAELMLVCKDSPA